MTHFPEQGMVFFVKLLLIIILSSNWCFFGDTLFQPNVKADPFLALTLLVNQMKHPCVDTESGHGSFYSESKFKSTPKIQKMKQNFLQNNNSKKNIGR